MTTTYTESRRRATLMLMAKLMTDIEKAESVTRADISETSVSVATQDTGRFSRKATTVTLDLAWREGEELVEEKSVPNASENLEGFPGNQNDAFGTPGTHRTKLDDAIADVEGLLYKQPDMNATATALSTALRVLHDIVDHPEHWFEGRFRSK